MSDIRIADAENLDPSLSHLLDPAFGDEDEEIVAAPSEQPRPVKRLYPSLSGYNTGVSNWGRIRKWKRSYLLYGRWCTHDSISTPCCCCCWFEHDPNCNDMKILLSQGIFVLCEIIHVYYMPVWFVSPIRLSLGWSRLFLNFNGVFLGFVTIACFMKNQNFCLAMKHACVLAS